MMKEPTCQDCRSRDKDAYCSIKGIFVPRKGDCEELMVTKEWMMKYKD